MGKIPEKFTIEDRIVVTFDICSSSNIIEDLKLTNNLVVMVNLIINIKRFLREKAKTVGFEIYKFTGDGWILLFPENTDGKCLIDFLKALSEQFKKLIKRVSSFLQTKPNILGITFGVDSGELMRITILGRTEYIGRPINIACRLQNAIKDGDEHPEYKVLVPKPFFKKHLNKVITYKMKQVERKLRNILGGAPYICIKIHLF
jgi:class 3 adenylate cyclase